MIQFNLQDGGMTDEIIFSHKVQKNHGWKNR